MKEEQLELSNRIGAVIDCLNNGMYEREETIAVALLAALAGESAFLLGPPGTAKSLIARRLACAFDDKNFFSYLMNKFSTPEEVFGPISIKELKEDRYVRKTEHFLPTADFAFLDEIWKAGPAILNTLLTIINERVFRNGTEEQKVPLKALIAASNETPPEGQGLEALYDRFIVRLYVPPMQKNENFEKLLNAKPTLADIEIAEELSITNKEWDEWRELIQVVDLLPETIQVVKLIKADLIEKNKKKGKKQFYVSDRRWQKAMALVKAAAFFCGRGKTNLADTLLLRHCLWTTEENREQVIEIVENSVRKSGFPTEQEDLHGLNTKKEELDKNINKELFHSKDIYATVNIGKARYFKNTVTLEHYQYSEKHINFSYHVPHNKMKTKGKFNPVDERGNSIEDLVCDFDGQGSYSTKIKERYVTVDNQYYDNFVQNTKQNTKPQKTINATPHILFHKGDKKEDVNFLLIDALLNAVSDITKKFNIAQEEVNERFGQLQTELETPFVPEHIRKIAVESIEKQLEEIGTAIQDCNRLCDIIVKSRE